jgi:UPF0755 protein
MVMKRFIIALVISLSVLSGIGLGAYKVFSERRGSSQDISNLKREDIRVTIIEGKRWEEIAAQLEAAGVTSYAEFTAIMTANTSYEGTLFPNTYRFFPNTPASDVITTLRGTYAQTVAGAIPTEEQLILASIVEREAQNDSERAVIAGVYQNRLRIGMKLDADPTVQYGKDTLAYNAASKSKTFTFWSPLVRADYAAVKSVYNTYTNRGLPPTPICNPGVKSIAAAMSPVSHDYFYFVHRDGQLLLSKTLAEHERKL